VSKNNGSNGSGSKSAEVKITCRNKKRCGKKFRIKVGRNDGFARTATCPHCGTPKHFTVDKNGKVHGPAAI